MSLRALLVVVLALTAVSCDRVDDRDTRAPATVAVTSPAFDEGEDIPVDYTCDGEDVPPPLRWEAPPADTAELVVIVDDPDAPDGPFVHWLVAGLPAKEATLDGSLPAAAVEGRNDFGDTGWGGPCPPPGDDAHTYRLRLLAVSEQSDLADGFTHDDLTQFIAERVVAEGVHSGRYAR